MFIEMYINKAYQYHIFLSVGASATTRFSKTQTTSSAMYLFL